MYKFILRIFLIITYVPAMFLFLIKSAVTDECMIYTFNSVNYLYYNLWND